MESIGEIFQAGLNFRQSGDFQQAEQMFRRVLRAELRPRMAASPLLDFHGFTRNVEAAYRQMWRTYCAQDVDESPAAD